MRIITLLVDLIFQFLFGIGVNFAYDNFVAGERFGLAVLLFACSIFIINLVDTINSYVIKNK